MNDRVRSFYDDLAPHYHDLFADWQASVRRQGATLDALIVSACGPGPHAILDCACGIGTQAIGLALRGHRVHGTDLSPAAVARAEREAEAMGVRVTFGVADVRRLSELGEVEYDVVLACDNALPHLLNDDDLRLAVAQMTGRLRAGGLFLASLRDYDRLSLERPRGEGIRVFDRPEGQRIAFQVWDWADDGTSYRLHQFLVPQEGDEWRTEQFATDYRALRRDDLVNALSAADLEGIRWYEPGESGYYQPIVTARRRGTG